AKHHVDQALITMASASGSTIRRIRRLCDEASVSAKIIPGVYELVDGRVNLSRMRDVAIDDLLRREPVELDMGSIAAYASGKVVLVTGAGGSIGSELCRQLCAFSPRSVILLERSENALFNVHRELIAQHPGIEIVPCVGDITDIVRTTAIF